jgi:redox-sensitive bicupin YhaK (pirin superfamily)
LLDADDSKRRRISLSAPPHHTGEVILFAGKKSKEPIAWHGPFVMNTQEQIYETISELQIGKFPPKRVDWD